jgi:hypothetical protein
MKERHVTHMRKMRNECRIFVDIPERTTPPLISRRIWEVNIEMDLK